MMMSLSPSFPCHTLSFSPPLPSVLLLSFPPVTAISAIVPSLFFLGSHPFLSIQFRSLERLYAVLCHTCLGYCTKLVSVLHSL